MTVTDGVIARIEPSAATSRVVAPAFVDPHVHLRTPGREDEETIASGTAAAAAGGYCAIVAMPNTDPVVDSAPILRGLVDQARREAVVPVGFMAAITRSLGGDELTEMGELADAGAAAFTDDGRPVTSAGMMRRALQYGAVTGRPLALHCEEPTLSGDGHVHEGVVSAELGLAGYPSVAESAMVERDLSLARYERRSVHLMHLSARESVEALEAAQAHGVEASGEVTPHHLVLTDEAVRSLDPNVKMNPPLRAETDRQRPARGAAERRHRRDRDRPRAARARGEGRPVRGGAVRRHRPRDLVRGPEHAPRPAGPAVARDPARAHVRRTGAGARPAGAADRGRREGEPRPARPRRGVDGEPRAASARAPPTAGCWASASAASCSRRSPTAAWCTDDGASSHSRTARSSTASLSAPRASRSARRSSRRP